MNSFFRSLLAAILLLNSQAVLATPEADASYIAQRNFAPEALEEARRFLKRSFAGVYYKPLSELGIEIADEERFIELIPEKDIAPFVDRLLSRTIERYLSIYTPEQLSALATLLRTDETATMQDILSEEGRQKLTVALEQARARAVPSGSDDPLILAVEDMAVQLDALSVYFEGDGAKAFGQEMAAALAPIFTLVGYGHEIARLSRGLDTPVILSALQADGILRFANPVQRGTLLRQLSASEEAGGIRFIKPPGTAQRSD